MNKELYKKLVSKMDLQEIFDTIKNDKAQLFKLMMLIFKHNPNILTKVVSQEIQNAQSDEQLSDFIKQQIIDLDQIYDDFNINDLLTTKKNKTSNNDDACGRNSSC